MKPVFANTFKVTHNKNQSELELSFTHIYTDHKFSVQNGALTEVSAQVADEVANILVSKDAAVALTRLLCKIVSGWGIDVTE